MLREASLGDGVVVYVSPTKALVNQVEADLYARFSKSYDKQSKARSMHGVFTKEPPAYSQIRMRPQNLCTSLKSPDPNTVLFYLSLETGLFCLCITLRPSDLTQKLTTSSYTSLSLPKRCLTDAHMKEYRHNEDGIQGICES